jgi:hypothetical protein
LPVEAGRIAPEVFEGIESAFFLVKDVDHHLEIIEYDPLARGKSIHRRRLDPIVLPQAGFNFACDGF